ncbi:hypothetical protein JXQ70_02375 [bacterium]|nr:hypothetical protein [bacterium]
MMGIQCLSVRNYLWTMAYISFFLIMFFMVNPTFAGIETRVLQSDQEGIIVEMNFSEPQLSVFTDTTGTYSEILMDDLARETRTGYPEIPYHSVALGVPIQGDCSFWFEMSAVQQKSVHTVKPVPQVIIENEQAVSDQRNPDEKRPISLLYIANPEVYSSTNPFPYALVEKGQDGYIRQQRVVTFRINPVQYRPQNKTIEWYSMVRLHVRYPENALSQSVFQDDSTFERIFDQTLLNAEQARNFRLPRQTSVHSGTFPLSNNAHKNSRAVNNYKIIIQEEGLYRITGQDFLNFGLDLSAENPNRFKMYNSGSEIAIRVYDGSTVYLFDPTDYIEFYGLPNTGIYTDNAYYWLQTGGGLDGLRMSSRYLSPASPSSPTSYLRTDHFEEHCTISGRSCFGGTNYNLSLDEDMWFWLLLYKGEQFTFNFNLPNLNTAYAGDVIVRLQLRGCSEDNSFSPDHRAKVTLNSASAETTDWDGAIVYTYEFTRSHSSLQETNNALVINAPAITGTSLNTFYLNWYEIDYSDLFEAENDRLDFSLGPGQYNINISNFTNNVITVYDITDPAQPVLVTNTTVGGLAPYVLNFKDQVDTQSNYFCTSTAGTRLPVSVVVDPPSNLQDPANCADYLIITYDDFYSAALQLDQHRLGQGYLTKTIQISDIFDEFSFGYPCPEAIRDFLTYVYTYWADPLVTYVIFVGDASCDHKNYQGYGLQDYVFTYYFLTSAGLTTQDHWFTLVSGTDLWPDFHLGRLAVATATEADNAIAKIIAYDAYPEPIYNWNHNVIFIADNPDSGGDFEASSDEIMNNYLPGHLNPVTLYVSDCNPNCNQMFLDLLNSDTESAPLISYFGHGNITFMAVEKVLKTADITSIFNADRLPIFINMTCYNNNFAYSHQAIECLGEVMTDYASNGAIGFLASTGFTYLFNNTLFAKNIHSSLYADPDYLIGPAMTSGKILSSLYLCPDEVLNSLHLGDPAISIKLAAAPPPVPDLNISGFIALLVLLGTILSLQAFSHDRMIRPDKDQM